MKIALLFLFIPIATFAQVNLSGVPQPAQFQRYDNQDRFNPNNKNVTPGGNPIYNNNQQQRQNEQMMREAEQHQRQQQEIIDDAVREMNATVPINYDLPSYSTVSGTSYYYEVYDRLIQIDTNNLSVKDINFQIENAYFENKQDKAQFDQVIKNSGDFILSKMKELNYDLQSNSAKNFMLFQFFSETLQLKSNGLKHTAFQYDFDDYMGVKEYSKMFVSKLLATKTGQCHSMPLLYLILAEQINAEAFLAFSPNHSYIRFRDDKGKWYNIELTNGMFSTTSYILQSGYIKSEALQNKIYMQNLSKKELLSQFCVDLANGYTHKFGYDEFVQKLITKALALYPNSISAHMVQSNLDTARFEYVMYQLGINPRKKEELQNIRYFPEAVDLLDKVNRQYDFVDNLGYEHMSDEAYQNWLRSMKEQQHIQDNETIRKQFKGLVIKKSSKN
ncbi:MAG TPA: hypothetical protein VF677_06375 [Flavobacterium sp.]|jgi:hypothetical protein